MLFRYFMKTFKLETPVLFMTFNRPDETKRVFEAIRKAKPKEIFISSDGPRNAEEGKKVDEIRKYILKSVDWDCKVKTLFHKKNLGCKNGCVSAITWFFEDVEQGIILEDDCMPDQSFFRFCQEMLERYKNNERIIHITGTNTDGISDLDPSYFFSGVSDMWGWASWRRAWKMYDVKMSEWPKYNSFSKLKKLGYRGILSRIKMLRLFRMTYSGEINTWDYQWDFIFKVRKKLSIVPKMNMITNIGVGGGTHTINYGDEKSFKRYALKFPLKHPAEIIEDEKYFKRHADVYATNIFKKIFELIVRKIKR